MSESLHVLLEHLVDYAGLFPPAALTMQDAVRNYARYREGEYAWALGRFVVPVERVKEVPPEFPLSVLGLKIRREGAAPDETPARRPGDSIEVKAASVVELDSFESGTFVELADTSLIPELKRRGLRAKIRTGGITADAFPTPESVARFIRACKEHGVAFKATAGLHHPLRCTKPLTYAPDAPTGTMHGFLNVFLAAALVDDAEEILRDDNPRSFAFADDAAWWRDRRATTEELAAMRRDFAISFGSCSFEEPIDDLKDLGWL